MHIKIAQMCFCRRLGDHMWTSKGTTIDSIVEEGGGGGGLLNFDFFHFLMGTFRKMTSQNNKITSYVQYADIMTSERSK